MTGPTGADQPYGPVADWGAILAQQDELYAERRRTRATRDRQLVDEPPDPPPPPGR